MELRPVKLEVDASPDGDGCLSPKIARSYSNWGQLSLWDSPGGFESVSHVHRLLSSILPLIGSSPVEWVVTDLDLGEVTYTTISSSMTLRTADLVVRALREPAQMWPVVSAHPCESLIGFELSRSQILTMSEFGAPDRSVIVRLSYPRFSVEIRDPRGERLPAAIPRSSPNFRNDGVNP
jgi:hypothetical protein